MIVRSICYASCGENIALERRSAGEEQSYIDAPHLYKEGQLALRSCREVCGTNAISDSRIC